MVSNTVVKRGWGHPRGTGKGKTEAEAPISGKKQAQIGPLEDDQVEQERSTTGMDENSPCKEPLEAMIWVQGFLSHCHAWMARTAKMCCG